MSTKCMKIVAVWQLLFFASLQYTNGKPGGSVLVTLKELENLDNVNDAGDCCNNLCGPCDYQLSIWVTCDAMATGSGCLYGMGKTGIFYNTSHITFTQTLGNGSRNPLVYNFTSFQGNLGIRVHATDSTGSKIYNYRFHQPVYPSVYGKETWTNATLYPDNGGRDSNINLTYQVFCKQHYYGPSCSVGCIPGANYKCDESTGKKICSGGWIGPNCTCKQNSKYNCDISTGNRVCYRPWYGKKCDVKCQPRNDRSTGYECDANSGAKLCLRGWYGKECNETVVIHPRVSSNTLERSTKTLKKTNILTILPSLLHASKTSTSGSPNFVMTTENRVHQSSSNYFVSNKMRSSSESIHSSPITSTLVTSLAITSTLVTSSPITSTLVTSSPIASAPVTSTPIASHMMSTHTTTPLMTSLMISSALTPTLMTPSFMTSNFMTTSTVRSKLQQPHVLSTLTLAEIPQPKSTSVTIRDRTVQTEHSYSQTAIITTSYTVEKTRTAQVNKERTEIVRYQSKGTSGLTNITWDPNKLSKSVPQIMQPVSTKRTDEENTRHFEENTERWHFLPVTVSTMIHEAKSSRSVSHDVNDKPTPRDTTFEAGSKEARNRQNVWWIVLLLLIVAILLIVIGIAILKRKNRKRRQVSPHYETCMQELKVKPESNERNNNDPYNDEKNTDQGDLEAIWKVMSTYHE